jgi:hypothetical protein
VEPRTLKFKGSTKSKNFIILVDYGISRNFVDIDLAKQSIFCVYLVRDLMVTTTNGQQIKGLE